MGIRKVKAPLPEVDGLDNESRVRVLGIIDKLSELGVNENVSLPQLVGLTGLLFPVAAGLCPRFATRIVLRRTAEEDAGAAAHMGVPGPSSTKLEGLDKWFSDDSLKIKLIEQHRHLSVVDIPSLFHSKTLSPIPGITEEDKIISRRNHSTREINEGVDIKGRYKKENDFFSSVTPWNKLKRKRVGATNALRGNYDPGIEADSPLKLRMHIQNLSDKFADTTARNGHAGVFRTRDGELDQQYIRGKNDQDIYTWICSFYRDSRGAELPGTVHPNVLMNMFCEQSLPWKSIAEEYLSNVGAALEIQLRRREEEAMANAKTQLRIELDDERRGPLQTSGSKKWGFSEGYTYNIKDLVTRMHQSNDDQAVDDMHDILKSFYKVAMKQFNDNVVVQVVEHCILGVEGAFQALTPELIGDLMDRALEDIAGENSATSSARMSLFPKLTGSREVWRLLVRREYEDGWFNIVCLSPE
ncbi:hypothetical protein BDW75DRAFT_248246 [Aspergillus navahoensis]